LAFRLLIIYHAKLSPLVDPFCDLLANSNHRIDIVPHRMVTSPPLPTIGIGCGHFLWFGEEYLSASFQDDRDEIKKLW